VFRRRRRDGGDKAGLEADEVEYAQDDDLDYSDEAADASEFDDDDLLEGDDDEFAADEDMAAGEEPGDRAGRHRAPRDDLGDPATWTRLRDSSAVSELSDSPAGPWDSASEYPLTERINFGSMLVPVREGYDVQIAVSEEQGITVAVVHEDSGLQLQPFAAPRSNGLWSEVRPEIAEEVAKAGGESREQDGPFGPELLARVSPQPPSEPPLPPQPLRFLGVDGPRWFLRGLISGPAATDRSLARPLEEIFADIVVVRGDHAMPPRTPLDILLPEEARQLLEDQLAAEDADLLNPFERGPEITETR
jgi:hypothetical protein